MGLGFQYPLFYCFPYLKLHSMEDTIKPQMGIRETNHMIYKNQHIVYYFQKRYGSPLTLDNLSTHAYTDSYIVIYAS